MRTFKTILLATTLSVASLTANATLVDFDNVASDVRGTELTFGDITITGGISDTFNLIANSFNISQITMTGIVQDGGPYGGLGVESGKTTVSDDNLQGSINYNTKDDEIMFFDFGSLSFVDSVSFNGDHTDTPISGIGIQFFSSTDGESYNEVWDNYKQFNGAFDLFDLDIETQYLAVAAVGPGNVSNTGVYIAGVEASTVTVPAPATLALLGLGLAGLGFTSRKKKA